MKKLQEIENEGEKLREEWRKLRDDDYEYMSEHQIANWWLDKLHTHSLKMIAGFEELVAEQMDMVAKLAKKSKTEEEHDMWYERLNGMVQIRDILLADLKTLTIKI
jgi:hypothetical protein